MKKGNLAKIAGTFFALMLLFTIISRAASQAGTAVVTVARPENKIITHEIRTVGKVTQNQEVAVTTEPGQRVAAIYVSEGEQVSKGDLLFEVDLTLLEEQILKQQQEMEKQSLQVKDAKSQKDVSAQQKASQQAQAKEQYSLSAKSAQIQLDRTKEELARAKKELETFRKSNETASSDSSVEEALTKACEEKTEAYLQAEQEQEQLEWEIEQAVYMAQQKAMGSASFVRDGTVHTQEAQIIGQDLESQQQKDIPQEAQIIGQDLESQQQKDIPQEAEIIGQDLESQQQKDTPQEAEIIGQDLESQQQDVTCFELEELTVSEGGGDEEDTYGDDATVENIDVIIDSIVPDSGDSNDGGSTVTSAALSQDELDRIEQSVRDSYASELASFREKVTDALNEKKAAEAALAEYQQEQLRASDTQAAETEKQLISNVNAARKAYEDAALAANEAAVTTARAVQQAGIPDASNSSDRMNEITYEQMELALEKLEKLKAADGKVMAPADGVITKISIMTGEKTADTTAILMADLSKGLCFEGEITKDQQQYIGTGDFVTLTGSTKKQRLEEIPVESVRSDEANTELYHVTVQLPESVFQIGAAATLECTKKSEAYPLCVPLSALHLDEKNQTYVLVTGEYDSIMGTELRARKVAVTVLEKNESYAALAEGTLTASQKVIVSSDKAVDAGSRVRMEGD